MAKKPTITSITSGYASTNTLNDNFEALRDAFDNTLSLDGSTPNSMTSDLNLNNNDILNASRILVGGVDYIATALSYKNAAEAAQTAAETAQAAAELVYDNFDDRYLGSKASDPTLDNDGDALLDGALYYDTINTVMKFYDTSTATWYRTTPTTSDQANIDIVAGNTTNINTVAGISSDVTTVAGISSDVTTVAADGTDIGTVATSISNVNTAATNISNINTVAGISANVTTVAGNTSNINTVATDISNVNTVAGQTTNLQNVTDNLTAIQNAATNATNAATSASNAATSETNAATSASNASTSETNAASSATAAAASAAAAASSADFFDDVYLGSKASDPSVDNDGDPLNAGDLYFNTTSNTMRVYSGSAWQDAAVDSSGFVQTTGDTMTGNLSFGDNDKAIFGAGSDLQIYHDGLNSYIDDAGTGNLTIRANQINFDKYTGEAMARFRADGNTELFYDNASKLATTSTGVDITGTLTSDGLTVDGTVVFDSSAASANIVRIDGAVNQNTRLVFRENGTDKWNIGSDAAADFFNIYDSVNSSNRLTVENSGDISFYEDTGTTAKFFWDASAEVLGIGTATPNVFSNTGLHIHDSTTSRLHMTNGTTGSAYTDGWEMLAFSDDFYILGREAAGDIIMYPANSEAMRIDSSGRVGIGTSSPSTQLEVKGSTYSLIRVNGSNTNNAGIDFGDTDDIDIGRIRYDNSSDAMQFWTNNAERMRIASSGRVGIGTTSPLALLDIASSVNSTQVRIRNTSTGTASMLFQDSTSGTTTGDGLYVGRSVGVNYLWTYESEPLVLATNNSEAMRIDSSGNVGIGTSSPSAVNSYKVMHFKGGATNNGGMIRMDTSNSSHIARMYVADALYFDTITSSDIVFKAASSEAMRIDSSGNLLVGKTSATGFGSTAGFEVLSDGRILSTVSGDQALALSRTTSDGNIAEFYKDGTTVGSIGSVGGVDLNIGTDTTGLRFYDGSNADGGTGIIVPWNVTANSARDAQMNLGSSTERFRNLYLSGGVNLSGETARTLLFKNTDTTVVNNDQFGVIDFESSDASVGAGGVRCRIEGKAANSSGGIGNSAIVFSVAAQSSTTLVETLRLQDGGIRIGGISAGSLLDDYEEGTWTPVFTGWSTTGTTSVDGSYTKIGNTVIVTGRFRSVTGSIASTKGTSTITGLPFSISGFTAFSVSVGQGGSGGDGVGANNGDTLYAPTISAVFEDIYFQATYHTT